MYLFVLSILFNNCYNLTKIIRIAATLPPQNPYRTKHQLRLQQKSSAPAGSGSTTLPMRKAKVTRGCGGHKRITKVK